MTFTSDIFPIEQIELDGSIESVLVGGRHLLPLLPQAFKGIEEIGVIGWGSQAPAQAQNLRDSLEGTGIRVTVGLRSGSPSWADAQAAGFEVGEMFDVIARADLVLLLISDAAQAELYPKVFGALRPGTTLGLSHGYLKGHLRAMGDDFPSGINVIGVCPKGMGPSVRRLYQQGQDMNGAGINTSFAVEQDVDGWATDIALAWAVAIGSPCTFHTTVDNEYRSDIFGERGVLLGAVHGVAESLYRRCRDLGMTEAESFERGCETITGPIARTISTQGLLGLFEGLDDADRRTFAVAYSAAYQPALTVLAEIYDEVDSGREISGVNAAVARMERYPMAQIEGTRMWQVGAEFRAQRATAAAAGTRTPVDPFAAGVFAAVMVAQVDLLCEHGHPWSEIANESIIEAVDSLIPFMHARGVAYMVDNCSVTARLGARRWGPSFEAAMARIAYPAAERGEVDEALFTEFCGHPLHGVLRTLSAMRPPVDIAVD